MYTQRQQINTTDIIRLLDKATIIQRDYKNLVKRK